MTFRASDTYEARLVEGEEIWLAMTGIEISQAFI
jgi:hypothetical protein